METDLPADESNPRWLISALVDGEGSADSVERGCAAWARGDVETHLSWHAYHLIGDVLRSDDLASPPTRDQAFLERLRGRLADEPAPSTVRPLRSEADSARGWRKPWALPLAMAASVMALAAGLVLTLGPIGGVGPVAPSQMAGQPVATSVAAANNVARTMLSPEPVAQGSRVVRDPRLDRYLRAHREFGATLPGSLPGGAGRGVSTVSYER
jgi:sigma-E factor negative regulatory protein RseA